MWPWRVKMPTQNLLRLLLLLMLIMRIVLATVCCILGSWCLVIKPNFCSDFEHKVWSRFWSLSSGKIWGWPVFFCWSFGEVMKLKAWSFYFMERLMFGWDFEDEVGSRFVFELVIRNPPLGPLCLWQCLYSFSQLQRRVVFRYWLLEY